MLRSRAHGFSGVFVAMVSLVATGLAANQAQVRQIRLNGVDLSYVEQGQGTPVVFVHGAASDLRFWEPQRAQFAERHRFVSYTYRYHGTAPWPDEGKQYSPESHVADLTAFISALKAGPVHLVGLSYGGLLAAMAALKEPDAIRSLTLAEPALFSLLAETPEGKTLLEEWNKGFEPVARAIQSGDNVEATRQLAALVTGEPPDRFDQAPAPLRELLLDNARTLPLLMAAPPPTVTCEMLAGIKVATLVVRGERTPRIFSQVNDEVGRCIADSRLAVIPKASHPMSYDNPADFNRVVLDFVAKTTARPPRAGR